MTHDDVAGYCTYDDALGKEAQRLLRNHNGDVLIKFRSIGETDAEKSFWDGSDCKTTSGSDIVFFKLESIAEAPPRNSEIIIIEK